MEDAYRGDRQRKQIEALIRQQINTSADEIDRANLLYDLTKAAYEATKMAFADRGRRH